MNGMRWIGRVAAGAVLAAGLLGGADGAFAQTKTRDEIRFLIGSDPQFSLNDYSARLRSPNTFLGMATFVANCTDCSRVMLIAGDLSMDGYGLTEYAESKRIAAGRGVKVLDGLGNHDTDLFEPDAVAFASESELRSLSYKYGEAPPTWMPPVLRTLIVEFSNALGWYVYDVMASVVDFDEVYGDTDRPARCDELGRDGLCTRTDKCGSFSLGDSVYCYLPALYYTVALRAPGSTNPLPSAYVVQLHNDLFSATATAYLDRVRTKLKDEGELSAPVILVAHQLQGAAKEKFNALVDDMNIAAILVGHIGCVDRNVAPLVKHNGHCDRANTIDDLRWSQWSSSDITMESPHPNVHGATPPILNVNAMLHNIFWSVQLRPDTNEIAFQRFNLGDELSTIELLTPDTYDNNIAKLRWMGSTVFNFPTSPFIADINVARLVPPLVYVCNYSVTGKVDDSLCEVRPF